MTFVLSQESAFKVISQFSTIKDEFVTWRRSFIPSSPPRVLVITTCNAVEFHEIEIEPNDKLRISFGPGLKNISDDGLGITLTLNINGESHLLLNEHVAQGADGWVIPDWIDLPSGTASLSIACDPGPENESAGDWLAISELFICPPEDYPKWRARQHKALRTKNEIAHFSQAYRQPMFQKTPRRNAYAYAAGLIQKASFEEAISFHVEARKLTNERKIEVLTLCCGKASTEASIFKNAKFRPNITLCDINEDLLGLAAENLADVADIDIICGDVNEIELPKKKFDVVICVAGLHHIVELEHIMDEISGALRDGGEFWSIGEYVGRNGARLWPEVYKIANSIFHRLPEKYRIDNAAKEPYVRQDISDFDCSLTTFEGIRAEEIEIVLKDKFDEKKANRWSTICWKIISPTYVENYDIDIDDDRELVEELVKIDVALLKSGISPHHAMKGIYIPKITS